MGVCLQIIYTMIKKSAFIASQKSRLNTERYRVNNGTNVPAVVNNS